MRYLLIISIALVGLSSFETLGGAMSEAMVGSSDPGPSAEFRKQGVPALATTANGATSFFRSAGRSMHRYAAVPIKRLWQPSRTPDSRYLANLRTNVWKPELVAAERALTNDASATLVPRRQTVRRIGAEHAQFTVDVIADIAKVSGTEDLGATLMDLGADARANQLLANQLFVRAAERSVFGQEPNADLIRADLTAAIGAMDNAPEAVALAGRIEALYAAFSETKDISNLTPHQMRLVFGEQTRVLEATPDLPAVETLAVNYFTRGLPSPGSSKWQALVAAARKDMLLNGYAVVPTGNFTSDGRALKVLEDWDDIKTIAGYNSHDPKSASVTTRHQEFSDRSKQTYRHASESAVQNLREWKSVFVNEVFDYDFATWSSVVQLTRTTDEPAVSFRTSGGQLVPAGHVDVPPVAFVTSFDGQGTVAFPGVTSDSRWGVAVPEGAEQVQVGFGDSVIFFGTWNDKIPELQRYNPSPLVHGSPAQRQNRLLITTAFGPTRAK